MDTADLPAHAQALPEGAVIVDPDVMERYRQDWARDRSAGRPIAVAEVKRAAGLRYPPDPSSFESCSIGGNAATNAGGLRAAEAAPAAGVPGAGALALTRRAKRAPDPLGILNPGAMLPMEGTR